MPSIAKKKILRGEVVSDKMDKTIVVKVKKMFLSKQYKKYVSQDFRYKAHDGQELAKMGDRVKIVESRPYSRDKKWLLWEVEGK